MITNPSKYKFVELLSLNFSILALNVSSSSSAAVAASAPFAKSAQLSKDPIPPRGDAEPDEDGGA
jgi:hypothetical protein